MKRFINYLPLVILLSAVFPEFSFASGGIDDFAGPIEKVVNTLTGDFGKLIAIAGIAFCGYMYVFNKEGIDGVMKVIFPVVAAITFISSSANIVDALFSFSGAIIASM